MANNIASNYIRLNLLETQEPDKNHNHRENFNTLVSLFDKHGGSLEICG